MKFKILGTLFVVVILIILYALTNSGGSSEYNPDGTTTIQNVQ